jgi:hypothetical protein
MVRVNGELDPETGDVLLAAIQAAVDADVRGGGLEGRPPAERRIDALGEICRQWLGSADRREGSPATRPSAGSWPEGIRSPSTWAGGLRSCRRQSGGLSCSGTRTTDSCTVLAAGALRWRAATPGSEIPTA